MTDATKLVACPFDGAPAEIRSWDWPYDRWQVRCTKCKATCGGRKSSEAEAIAAWNTRPGEAAARKQALERAAEPIKRAGEAVEHARCSTCGATDPRDPDKWYCSNGFHAPSPVEAGILALLRFHRSQVPHQSRNEVASLDAAIEALRASPYGQGKDGR